MDFEKDLKLADALHPAAAPALLPAVGVLVGTCAASHLGYLPPGAIALLVAFALALPGRIALAVAAAALGLLNAGLRPAEEPRVSPRQPVELVAVVTSHPVRHDDETFFHARAERLRQGPQVTTSLFYLRVTVPTDAPAPSIGATVRLRGYLRRSAGFANVPVVDPGPWRIYLKSDRFLTLEHGPGPIGWLAGRLRGLAEAAFASTSESPGLALARALLLGDRSRLPKAWQQALRRSGLAHLLAVSGLHIGLLAAGLLLAGAALPTGWRYLPALAGVAVYLLLVGPRPPAMRAGFMGLLALGALALDRPPRGVNALACCVALLVLHDPSLVGDLGFQLSVAATAGILVLMPVFAPYWTALPAACRRPLAVTVAAQLVTLPWTLPLAAGVHPLAPLLNLVAIPCLTFFLLLAFIWLGVAVVWSAAADAMVPSLDVAARAIEVLVALPPGPALFLPLSLSPTAVLILVAAGVAAGRWPKLAARSAVTCGLMVLTGGGAHGDVDRPASGPEMVMLDVGQGDAILLRDGSRAALIDGGGWQHGDLGGRVLVPALAALGVRRLTAIVLTHPDLDHCGGLVDVARYLPVKEIWMGPGWHGKRCATQLLTMPTMRWRPMWKGQIARLGGWRIEVLHPSAGERRGLNDRSLVLLAQARDSRLLLTGDVTAAVERRLIKDDRGALREGVDILKVAHHGSKTSTSRAFLETLRPRLAVISAGPHNSYGHPHPMILERLLAAGCRVLRTDRSGMIRVRLGPGGKLSVETPSSPRQISGK